MTSSKISLLQAECLASYTSSVQFLEKLTIESNSHEGNKCSFESLINELDAHSVKSCTKTVHLNMGGAGVFVSRTSLLFHGTGNYLFKLLSGKYDHLLPKDKNGRIFLDLDVKWVEPEFNWLRDMVMWNGDKESMPKVSRSHLLHECGRKYIQKHFFGTSNSSHTNVNFFAESIILSDEKLVGAKSSLVEMLTVEGSTVSERKLLFQAYDGEIFEEDFRSACDRIENILFLIRDAEEGNVFGGFLDVSWERYRALAAPKAFVFSLLKDNEFNPVKHTGLKGCAVECPPGVLLAFINTDNYCYDLCFRPPPETSGSGSCSFTQIGLCFEEKSQGLHKQSRKFQIQDIEVYRIVFATPASETSEQCDDATVLLRKRKHIDMILAFKSELHAAQSELLQSTKKLCAEQRFIAKFLGVNVPIFAVNTGDNLTEFQLLLHEIQMIDNLLTANNDQTRDISEAVSSIAYINVGGTVLAVSKATLLQAPSGSILANMASDVWGHDLDSEGNIIQDVNPELFTAIINHLRLKALLFDTEVPPITVYKEQKTALDNLLAFYGMENVHVKLIAKTTVVYKSVQCD